jgi:hypothetical protein
METIVHYFESGVPQKLGIVDSGLGGVGLD